MKNKIYTFNLEGLDWDLKEFQKNLGPHERITHLTSSEGGFVLLTETPDENLLLEFKKDGSSTL